MQVTLEEIAADTLPGADGPAGPLPASPLGVKPDTDEYREIVENVKRQIEAHLAAFSAPTTLLKLALIRYYAAQAVLSRARTGSVKDPSGASITLSGSDLAPWQNMKEEAAAEINRYVPSRSRGGVYFAEIEVEDD